MTYQDNIWTGYDEAVLDAYCRYLASLYDGNVTAVILTSETFRPPDPPPPYLGFWDKVRQPLILHWTSHVYGLNLCDDLDEHCAEWAEDGELLVLL